MQISMLKRALLDPYPTGWYNVALSEELSAGQSLNGQFMGHDVILFRTESGEACVMEAYCPHLGAHLGHGGEINGEFIRCPFHFFEFDTHGACVSTGYDTRPPPLARARTWPLREANGFIFVYHGKGDGSPTWEIPDLDMEGWTPPITRTFRLRGHPQETTENSVDIGHLGIVHGYRQVEILDPLELDGPRLKARYAMQREAGGFLGCIQTEFEVHVHGLGYSWVQVSIKNLGLNTRQFVFATPIDGDHIHLRIALSLQRVSRMSPLPRWLRLIPPPVLNAILPPVLMEGFAHDVSQDFPIWKHKIFVQPPALAEGDGPVGRYRQWAQQFYLNSKSHD